MHLRAKGFIAWLCAGLAVLALIGFSSIGDVKAHAGVRVLAGIIGLYAVGILFRLARSGLILEPNDVTIRGVNSTERIARVEVLGLAQQAVGFGRFRRLAVVCKDGRVLPATWTVATMSDLGWAQHGAYAASGFGPTQAAVAETLAGIGRLERNDLLPVVTMQRGLSPASVSPDISASRWMGWETIFVVTAFALPGVAAAVQILAQHVGGVSDLNEFDLPLPHHPGVSMVILILGYLTTALIVPIALLLLARTGQSPASLGLKWERRLGTDATKAVGLLAAIWSLNLVAGLILSPLLNNKHLTNTESNSHVPAYFIIYALVVSATTAINEEVIVNGYFLTRLSQRGWSPRAAFAMSLAVRTSYHAYYGAGIFLTIPFGIMVTRSFQKHGRLGRSILTHFLYDAPLLIIAVLTS